jgi:hypothetical protein
LKESGDLGAIAVLGIIMLVVTTCVVAFANRYAAKGGARLRING